MRACMNKELCAALDDSEDSGVTSRDGERAQLAPKGGEKKGGKVSKPVWREPGDARALRFPPAVHAHWRAGVQRCGARGF